MLGESVYTLVRSSRRSERAAVLVHKLRLRDVAEAPAPRVGTRSSLWPASRSAEPNDTGGRADQHTTGERAPVTRHRLLN